MKTKIAAALFAVAAMLTTACEKHNWSETSKLFKHGEHAGHGEGEAHGGAGAAHEGAAHGEKKPGAHGEAAKHQ
jgi:hypothetical protein